MTLLISSIITLAVAGLITLTVVFTRKIKSLKEESSVMDALLEEQQRETKIWQNRYREMCDKVVVVTDDFDPYYNSKGQPKKRTDTQQTYDMVMQCVNEIAQSGCVDAKQVDGKVKVVIKLLKP